MSECHGTYKWDVGVNACHLIWMGDIMHCRTELWVRRQHITGVARVRIWKFLNFSSANKAPANQITCHYDDRVCAKLQTRPPSSVDANAPCECPIRESTPSVLPPIREKETQQIKPRAWRHQTEHYFHLCRKKAECGKNKLLKGSLIHGDLCNFNSLSSSS